MSEPCSPRQGPPISLLDLPSEVIHHICSHATPNCLGRLLSTCQQLRHEVLVDDLWAMRVNSNLPVPLQSPAPMTSWRQLYISFHHFWFLLRHRLWVSNLVYHGGLLVARWNARDTSIDLIEVVGNMGPVTERPYSETNTIQVVTYQPRHALLIERPFFKIRAHYPDKIQQWIYQSGLCPLLCGQPGVRQGVLDYASFAGHRPPAVLHLAEHLDYEEKRRVRYGDRIWPQPQVPAPGRVKRCDSRNRPIDRFCNPSQAAFRYRSAPNFPLLAHDMKVSQSEVNRRGEPTSFRTFGTIDPSCYTPTAAKPYQGIWCGDFNGHGMEYLLILQPDEGDLAFELDYLDILKGRVRKNRVEPTEWDDDVILHGFEDHTPQANPPEAFTPVVRLPPPAENEDENYSDDGFQKLVPGRPLEVIEDFDDVENENLEDPYPALPRDVDPHNLGHHFIAATKPGGTKSGERLVAIKLTGDPNVPRGEVSWVAYCLGRAGYLSHCHEPEFRGGKRVVSQGHVAYRGFTNGTFELRCKSTAFCGGD